MDVASLALEIFRIVQGGDVSSDAGFSMTDYKEAVQQACATLIRNDFYNRYKFDGTSEVNSNYLEIYEGVEVQYNSVRDIYYVVTPADILSLPKDYGVQYVGQNKSLDNPFTRLTFGNRNFFTKLPNDITSWILTENNIEFTNFNPLITNLVVAIIPAKPNSINNDDASQIKDIVLKQMFPFMNVQEDKLTNQNPNQKDITPARERQ